VTKNPKLKNCPTPQKSVRIAPKNFPDSFLKNKPVWRFAWMDINGPWGWLKIDSAKIFIHILHEKLKYFETMTWQEIDKNRQNHIIPVSLKHT